MQARCQRCGWSLNLGRDFLAAAVAEADEKNLKYYQIECGKCRHNIKLPMKQIRRFAPKPAPAEDEDNQD